MSNQDQVEATLADLSTRNLSHGLGCAETDLQNVARKDTKAQHALDLIQRGLASSTFVDMSSNIQTKIYYYKALKAMEAVAKAYHVNMSQYITVKANL